MAFLIGFTADSECDNCSGTGVFSYDEQDQPDELCIFCLEDAIRRGEIDGVIAGVVWNAGKVGA